MGYEIKSLADAVSLNTAKENLKSEKANAAIAVVAAEKKPRKKLKLCEKASAGSAQSKDGLPSDFSIAAQELLLPDATAQYGKFIKPKTRNFAYQNDAIILVETENSMAGKYLNVCHLV